MFIYCGSLADVLDNISLLTNFLFQIIYSNFLLLEVLVVENRVSSISSLKVNVSATQQIFIVNFWDYEFNHTLRFL